MTAEVVAYEDGMGELTHIFFNFDCPWFRVDKS